MDQLVSRIKQQCNLSFQVATACLHAIKTGPWAESQKDVLVQAVNRALERASSQAVQSQRLAHGGNRHNHNMEKPDAYLTQSLLKHLKDSTLPIQPRISLLANHLAKLGCTCPDEATKAGCTAMVLILGQDNAENQMELFNHYKSLTTFIQNLKVKRNIIKFPHASYPETLEEFRTCHPDIYESVFRYDEPAHISLPDLQILAARIPQRMRSTSQHGGGFGGVSCLKESALSPLL